MSVQFGRWNFEEEPPAPDYIEKVGATLAPYGPDSDETYSTGGIRILYRAFHTTKESHREKQPHISSSGAVITWDGRLDNRAELISELRDSLTVNSTDVAIVAAAYEKWSAGCLGKLIGDWALSIWNPRDRSVLLAKDPIGTKHLYYSLDDKQLTWSTILDPLVRFAGRTFEICEEYIAGWLAIYFPAAHLTPYVGIHAVPPSCFVLLNLGRHGPKHIVTKYWDFDSSKRIRYSSDADYEEHFRTALATAVQRRLRSDRPVLAELSGGMDSSSIVCMADVVIAQGQAQCPRLDTISWFDDSHDHLEPDTNELHWISKVEEKRSRPGLHINFRDLKSKEVSSKRSFTSEFDNDQCAVVPRSSPSAAHVQFLKRYAEHMESQGHRVVLSGVGGGEVTGGEVPTPTTELQDLLVRARFFSLIYQLNAWATKMRRHRVPLLWEALQGFFFARAGLPGEVRQTPWFHPSFVQRNRDALRGYPFRTKLFGPLPSFQDNIRVLDGDRRLLAWSRLQPEIPREIRFPYFDRSLLEFIYAIPREQIVGVGQRRFLMKRALVGFVPDELLNRRRKTFAPQESNRSHSPEWPDLVEIGQHVVGSSIRLIDSSRLLKALQDARDNEPVPIETLKRTLTLESWLRHLALHGVVTNLVSTKRQEYSSSLELRNSSLPLNPKV
jgi:asparagine synthase (glutamine-hydrolysing)